MKGIFAVLLVAAGAVIPGHALRASTHLRSGMLIQASGPEVFVLENGFKRWVESAGVFNAFEFDWRKIRRVQDAELEQFPPGPTLTQTSRYPSGILLRASSAKGGDGARVYRVDGPWKYWIETPRDFDNLGLFFADVFDVSPLRIEALSDGGKLKRAVKGTPPSTVFTLMPSAVVEDQWVRFGFTGQTGQPEGGRLEFDTFLAGADDGWVRVSAGERTIKLPARGGRYTFYVRAVTADGRIEAVPQKAAFEYRISSSYGKVGIANFSIRSTDPRQEWVALEAQGSEPVALTGWQIGSEKANTFFPIPAAVAIPNHPGEVEAPLMLSPGVRLTIFAGKSPLAKSFRLNNCLGYLQPLFNPAIAAWCPALGPETTKNLSAYCRSVLDKTPACRAPSSEDFLLDAECRDFINQNLTYQSCVLKNRSLHTFFRDEWYAYLELSREVWASADDAVVLRDPAGLVVARWAY